MKRGTSQRLFILPLIVLFVTAGPLAAQELTGTWKAMVTAGAGGADGTAEFAADGRFTTLFGAAPDQMKRQGTYTFDNGTGELDLRYDDGDHAVYTLKSLQPDRLTFTRDLAGLGMRETLMLYGDAAAAFSMPDPAAGVKEAAACMEEGDLISLLLLLDDMPVFLDGNARKAVKGTEALDRFKEVIEKTRGKDRTIRILNDRTLEAVIYLSDWELWTLTLYGEMKDGAYKVILVRLFTDMMG